MKFLDIGEIPAAPPALVMILREFALGGDWETIRRRIRGCISDLREQSLVFECQNSSRFDSNSPNIFDVHLHGALDLLSGHGCMALNCRVAAAERLARSLGLIADRIWLTDRLSSDIVQMGRVTNAKIERLMEHAMVLAPLVPLIAAGIVRFRSPWMATCASCAREFESQVEVTTREVLKVFRRDFRVEPRAGGGYVVKTGKAFEPPMILHSMSHGTDHIPSDREFALEAVHREVRQVLWTAREASMTGGSIFTNSRIGLAGLLQREGRLPDRRNLALFDDNRSLELPWVSELSAEQILQLREEATTALPALREQLTHALVLNGVEPNDRMAIDIVASLRAQAAEVRAELAVKRTKSARYWKTTYGVLGLALSAYGVATDQVVPGLAGLLPVIQLLIGHKTGHETDVARLNTRPGYVLIKAQDILRHTH